MEDNDLLNRLRQDYETGFELIMREFYELVFNVAYSYVGNKMDAEDIGQSVFMKIYRKLNQFRSESSLKTWIYRITMNQCHDFTRQKSLKTVSLEDREEGYSHIQEQMELAESSELVRDSLMRLPAKFKDVVILKDMEGLTYKEIADSLGISIGTVESRLYRARMKLKKELHPLSEDLK